MKNPTTIEEIINWPKEYRVINTGEDSYCLDISYDEGTIRLKNNQNHWFLLSEVRELTPLSFEGKRIAIGDWVNFRGIWYQVYSYEWFGGSFTVSVIKDDSINRCLSRSEKEITGHKTTKHDEEVEKAIKLLTDKGIIIDGKVIL